MASNPKLEFFKFKLKHKNENTFKSFRDFAEDTLTFNRLDTNEECFNHIFRHFIQSLDTDIAKDSKLQRCLKLEDKPELNEFLEKKPVPHSSDYILQGVINGGVYGRKRILHEVDNNPEDEGMKLTKNHAVYSYYYIYVYLPPDHNEGMFMIHSSGGEDTATRIFRKFIEKLFRKGDYIKAEVSIYCPQMFQEEFRDGAILKSLSFNTTIQRNDYLTENSTDDIPDTFDITIEIKPKQSSTSISFAENFRLLFSKLTISGSKATKELNEFERTRLKAENRETKSKKVFEWNSKDKDFVPVVYLKDRIQHHDLDGSPDFDELNKFCDELFKSQILKDLRPDLNVTKIN